MDDVLTHCLAWGIGGTIVVWAGAYTFGRVTSTPARLAPRQAETLDEALARLKGKAGNVTHPVAATVFAMTRNPAAFAPTPETEALARQFKARERRLKRAKARREAVARTTTYIRNVFRTTARRLGFWS